MPTKGFPSEMKDMRVLLIEDDASVAEYLSKALTERGHHVQHAADGLRGLEAAQHGRFDLLLVDRMLPRMDGLSVIHKLRGQGDTTPAIIISALGDVDDRVRGLRAGGDDYLVKPFALEELHARMEALARRTEASMPPTRLKVADLEMDLLTHKVTRGGVAINLQPREFRLLEYLMKHAGQVVTRTMLLENVWDYNFDPQTNVIDVHVSRLRQKVDKEFDQSLISTVRGAGYLLSAPAAANP